jgi:serine/threonine-protein kinase RsbW
MGTVERKFTLQVQSQTDNLVMIREFVTSIGERAGLAPSEINKLELAVDEACANVIEHAYEHDATQEVVVRAIFDEETLQIHVEDTGRGFDPKSVPQAELQQLVAERKSGGLGLRLLRQLMDEVDYEIVPGEKNRLRLTKRIRKPSPQTADPGNDLTPK